MKAVNKLIEEVFPEGQKKLIQRAIVKSTEVSPHLWASTLRIGNDISVLLLGEDDNGNTHYTMMSEASFNALKKIKL